MDDDDEDVIAQHQHGPDWRCRACRDPWPCWFFQRRLLAVAHGRPQNLRIYMKQYRKLAGAELMDVAPEELDARFLGWLTCPPIRRRLRSI